jgi:hypothetical protein
VVEVDRADRQDRRRNGKSDPLDAVSAARPAPPCRCRGGLPGRPRTATGRWRPIRSLMVAKRSAPHERTQAINQARALILTSPDELGSRFAGKRAAALAEAVAVSLGLLRAGQNESGRLRQLPGQRARQPGVFGLRHQDSLGRARMISHHGVSSIKTLPRRKSWWCTVTKVSGPEPPCLSCAAAPGGRLLAAKRAAGVDVATGPHPAQARPLGRGDGAVDRVAVHAEVGFGGPVEQVYPVPRQRQPLPARQVGHGNVEQRAERAGRPGDGGRSARNDVAHTGRAHHPSITMESISSYLVGQMSTVTS